MKIMIVDDEEILVKGFYKMLPWKEIGMEIVADARNGRDALDKLYEMKDSGFPDVIIIDIKMHVMDGIELTKRLKEEYPRLPIIVLSNHEDYSNVRLAMKYGAMDYILKAGLSPVQMKDYLLKLDEDLKQEKTNETFPFLEKDEVDEGKEGANENLKQVIEYINSHFVEKDVTLAFLANKFFIQKNYLCTIFKQEMNTTVTDYIVNLRMKKAKNLMRTTNLSIMQIAEKVSYTDLSYFNRLFKKENGMSPREYINLIREK